jgi:hypothetical protein
MNTLKSRGSRESLRNIAEDFETWRKNTGNMCLPFPVG